MIFKKLTYKRLVYLTTFLVIALILLLLSLFVANVIHGPSFIDDNFFASYVWSGFAINCLFFSSCFLTIKRKKTPLHTTLVTLLLFVCFVMLAVAIDAHHLSPNTATNKQITYFLIVNAVVKLWFLVVSWLAFTIINLAIKTQYYNELQLATIQSELSLLKSQTNPHFLFNTLNSLYASSFQFGDKNTAQAIGHMAGLLRYMLHNNQQTAVSLEAEIDHIEDYIALQQFRFKNNLNVSFIQEINATVFLAPMLLMPLIENAFKYGVIPNEQNNIDIHLTLDEHQLTLNVINTDKSKQIKQQSSYIESGWGLDNLKQRLNMLYNQNFILNCQHIQDSYVAKLELKI